MSNTKPDLPDKEKIKESVLIRGVCASIQAMNFPTLEHLLQLLNHAGFKINKEE